MKKKVWILVCVLLLAVAIAVTIAFMTGCSVGRKAVATLEKEQPQWLELPAVAPQGNQSTRTHYARMEGRRQRNYTMLYDPQTYTSYWVAYPLCHSHMTTGRDEIWAYDPSVSRTDQTSVSSGYGASQPTENYPKNFYARGHQLPNADRNAVPQMQEQTY